MGLFKAKTADELEERLMKVVNKFSNQLGLRDEVESKMENANSQIKLGLVGGLGIGALGVVGGLTSIAVVPAIAATTVAGLTVAGAAIAAGGVATAVGLGYAAIGKLYSKYQEGKLGSLHSQISEEHRLRMVDRHFASDFSLKFNTQTNYKHYSKEDDLYNIMQAIKNGDMDQAKKIVKEVVAQTDLPERKNKKSLFKEPVADDMNSKLGKFFDEYRNKLMGVDTQNEIMKRDTKMGVGMLAAMGAAMGSAAAIVTLSSPAVIGGAIGLSFAAMAYSGIQKIFKTGLEQRNAVGFQIDANSHIHNAARDLNINADDLRSIQHITNNTNASISEMKKKFINETSNRIKNKIN